MYDILHDRLLGMLAVEKRFITEKQLKKCLNLMEFEQANSLKDVLLAKGYLTIPQAKRLEEELESGTTPMGPQEEAAPEEAVEEQPKAPSLFKKKRFGDIAIESHFIAKSQIDRALQEQDKYLERGIRVPIGQILCRLNFLTLPQLKKLLQSQFSQTLYCKRCKITKVITGYNPSKLYQCESCKLDLIEISDQKKPEPDLVSQDEDEEGEEDINDFREIQL